MSRTIDTILDRLEKSVGLTSDGRDWLIAAADPFHDKDLSLAGYPDLTTASTVVQLVKKSFQITVPTSGNGSVASGNNWDCSITLFPMSQLFPVSAKGTITNAGAYTNSGVQVVQAGGCCIAAGPQSGLLWPTVGNDAPTATYTGVGWSEYAKGNVRVIGMGFEVINSTANINKQGQVTAYRMPNIVTPQSCYVTSGTTPAVQVPGSFNLSRFPPASLAEAELLYGSRSWAAEEGAYVVSRLTDTTNPLLQPSTIQPVFTAYDQNANDTTPITVFSNVAPNLPFGQMASSNFDLSGVYFTGLSYSTTLTVHVRWILERMPGPREADLVVLATPSAPYDSVALELYTRCMRDMPPGVMRSENPLGEWFKQALSAASEFLPTVGAALNNALPGAGAIGSSLGGLAKTVAGMIKTRPEGQPQGRTLPGSASDLAPSSASSVNVSRNLARLGIKAGKRKKVKKLGGKRA